MPGTVPPLRWRYITTSHYALDGKMIRYRVQRDFSQPGNQWELRMRYRTPSGGWVDLEIPDPGPWFFQKSDAQACAARIERGQCYLDFSLIMASKHARLNGKLRREQLAARRLAKI